ncbi:MAG: hypothetical protein SNJ68_00830 [Cyanobacteriota bacterium]
MNKLLFPALMGLVLLATAGCGSGSGSVALDPREPIPELPDTSQPVIFFLQIGGSIGDPAIVTFSELLQVNLRFD